MSEATHTPGPWAWVGREGYTDLVGANGVIVHSDGSACNQYAPDIDVNGPDAHLIAAAPDLYDALWAILYADQDNQIPNELFQQAKEALDKAKGETAYGN